MGPYESYKRELDYGYAPGVFAALELAQARPDALMEIWLHPDGQPNAGVKRLREVAAALHVPVSTNAKWVERIAKKGNCYAVAAFRKYPPAARGGDHLLLHRPADAGNLGTLVRGAVAFGFSHVAIVGGGVDAFSPAAVRASMGAVFRLEIAEYGDFDAYRAAFPGQRVYPFMLDGAIEPERAAGEHAPQVTLAMGNEGAGLPPEAARWGQPVRIPQTDGVDSLNLAVAASIGMYLFARRPGGRLHEGNQ
nr:RNA methyltransferase [bacterium]